MSSNKFAPDNIKRKFAPENLFDVSHTDMYQYTQFNCTFINIKSGIISTSTMYYNHTSTPKLKYFILLFSSSHQASEHNERNTISIIYYCLTFFTFFTL